MDIEGYEIYGALDRMDVDLVQSWRNRFRTARYPKELIALFERPVRQPHEPGPEMTLRMGDKWATFRQVGWHGQTGAFYSLDEDPRQAEPGSFSPLWVIVHTRGTSPY